MEGKRMGTGAEAEGQGKGGERARGRESGTRRSHMVKGGERD